MPRILCACVLAIQAVTDLPRCAPALDELFAGSSGEARIWQVASFTVLIRATPPEWVGRLERMVDQVVTENGDSLQRYLACSGSTVDLFSVALPLAYAKQNRSPVGALRTLLADGDDQLRESAVNGLTVVGLYYPDVALSSFSELMTTSGSPASGSAAMRDLVRRALLRMRPMHSTMVDVFLRETGLGVAGNTVQTAEMQFANTHVDILGLYNNAVHQGAYYPLMRRQVLAQAFLSLLASGSAEDFVRSYAPKILKLLRDTDYELIRWTY